MSPKPASSASTATLGSVAPLLLSPRNASSRSSGAGKGRSSKATSLRTPRWITKASSLRQVTIVVPSDNAVSGGFTPRSPHTPQSRSQSSTVELTSGVNSQLLFATSHDIAVLYEAKLYSDIQQDLRHEVRVTQLASRADVGALAFVLSLPTKVCLHC
jgi:hypothetical protein